MLLGPPVSGHDGLVSLSHVLLDIFLINAWVLDDNHLRHLDRGILLFDLLDQNIRLWDDRGYHMALLILRLQRGLDRLGSG